MSKPLWPDSGNCGRSTILGVDDRGVNKLRKNLVTERGIGVDDSQFVSEILRTHGDAVKVGEIAATTGHFA
jgi:hypothetical protein